MSTLFKKYYNEQGEVAVIISEGLGVGWSTQLKEHATPSQLGMLFDRELVELALQGRLLECEELAEQKYGAGKGGSYDLKVKFLKQGTKFIVTEYDGSESLKLLKDIDFKTA